MNEPVNWSIFNIDPWNGSQDVTKAQLQAEFKKYSGTPREFAKQLAFRFEWSGYMCDLAEQWAGQVDNKK